MTVRARLRRLGALVLVLACAALGVPACATGRTVEGPELSPLLSAPPPSGAPLKVMTWAPGSTSTAVEVPDVPVVAQAFADTINAEGGVNGRPLVVISCDERGEAAGAAQCARRAVDERVLAVVGSFSSYAAAYLPVLEAAGIPYLGGSVLTAPDLTSAIAFPITGGLSLLVAGAARMASLQGCRRTAMLRQDEVTAPELERFATAALAAGGSSLTSVTVLPSGVGPIAAQVERATRDSDCILAVTGEQDTQRFLAAYQQLGATQRLFTIGGGHSNGLAAQFPEVAARTYLTDTLPPASNGVWQRYRDALARAPGGTPVDADGTVQRHTWAAFEVFLQVARQLTTFDARSMLATLRATRTVDTGGLVPSLNFTRDAEVSGMNRLFNPTVTFQRFVDGHFAELRLGFQDMTPVLAAAAGR